jgi:HK97 gp10 family phage protein
MSIKFDGMEEVLNRIETLEDFSNISKSLDKACALVEASAKRNAPKGSGELRRSITSKVDGVEGVVFTPLLYAPYVEYGTGLFAEEGGRTDVPWTYKDDEGNWHITSGMPPHPFMRPALYENTGKIMRILKEGLTND